MRWALLIVGLISFAHGATAGEADAPKNQFGQLVDLAEWNPPSRFDHSYAGTLKVRRLPQDQVVTACQEIFKTFGRGLKAGLYQRGCSANLSPTSCTIVIIDRSFRGTTPEAAIRHEIGHCNGWPANHPD